MKVKVFLRKWFSKIIRVALALIIVGSTLAPLAAPARVAAAPFAAPLAALTSNLLAHWTFDSGRTAQSGNQFYSVDEVAGSQVLGACANVDMFTITGTITTAFYPGGCIGGGSLTYTNTVSATTFPVTTTLSNSATIAAWVSIDNGATLSGEQNNWIIVGRGLDWAVPYHSNYDLSYKTNTGAFTFQVSNESGTNFVVTSTATATNNAAWHYVVGRINTINNTLGISVDGSTFAETTYSGNLFTAAHPSIGLGTYVGHMPTYASKFAGRIDELSIWGRALDLAEVQTIYNSGYACAYSWSVCTPPDAAWQVGNYIADSSMENDTVWDNSPWGSWGSGPAWTFSRRQTVPWTNLNNQPACGSYLRVSTNSGNGATLLHQKFMWYGGDMYLSFALRTDGNMKVYPYLTTPFGNYIALAPNTNTSMPTLPATESINEQFYFRTVTDPLATQITDQYINKDLYPLEATGSNWQVFTVALPDQWLGQYELVFFAKGLTYAQYAIDCVTVSEVGYEPQTYNATPLDAPTPHGTLVQRVGTYPSPSTGNLVGNGGFSTLVVGAVSSYNAEQKIRDWYTGKKVDVITLNSGETVTRLNPNPSAVDLAEKVAEQYERKIETAKWIEVGQRKTALDLATEYVETVDKRGMLPTKAYATTSHLLFLEYLLSSSGPVTPGNKTWMVDVQNIDTGEVFSPSTDNVTVLPTSTAPAYRHSHQFDVPYGRYRLRFMSGATTEPIFLDKVCVASDIQVFIQPDCATDNAWELAWSQLVGYGLTVDQLQLQSQQTAIARATSSIYANATSTQAWANYYGTATQAAVLGNAAQQQTAIAQINYAATATPAAAATGTAFVRNFNATNTAIAGNAQTQAAANVITSGQSTAMAQTQSAVSTQQAAAQATLWGQATSNARLTQQVSGQATLVQQQTANAISQATLAPQRTVAAQTQQAAQTQLAAGANATSAYAATQAAANSTAVQAVQQTLAAQSAAQQTQSAIQVATQGQYAGTATAIAQYQPTLMWQQQQQATQQVLQYPPTQPDFAWDANCNKPDNPYNLAWWLDYEPCRILAWFSWSPVNTTQVTNLPRLCNDYEPCGTFNGLKRAIDTFMLYWPSLASYDGQQCTRRVVEPGSIFRQANGFMNGTQPFSITVTDTGAINDQCDLAISTIVGPGLKRGFCITINFLCYYGLLPWFSWAVNFATITLTLFYIKILRGRVIV